MAFLLEKKNILEKGRFFEKSHGLTLLQNVDFFDFARTSLFRSKKNSFLSRRSKNASCCLSLLKRTDKEKVHFFGKNHGLTPFQNVDFLNIFRTYLLWSKKHSFLSRISRNVFFCFFFRSKKNSFLSRRSKNASCCLSLLKRTDKEKVHFFGKNHGLTPFQNVDFLNIFRTYLLWSKKHSFLSRISKNVFFCFFLLKKNI